MCCHQILIQELKEPKQVEVIDRRPIETGDVMHISKVCMNVQGHGEQLPMFHTKLGHYPIILRIPWLRLHHVPVRFALNTVTFGSQYGVKDCHIPPITVQGVMEQPPEPVYQIEERIFDSQTRQQRPFGGNIVMRDG